MASQVGNAIWVLENLSELVRSRREAAGLSLRELADLIGVSHSHIWGIEQGTKNPGLDTVIAVLRWLDDAV